MNLMQVKIKKKVEAVDLGVLYCCVGPLQSGHYCPNDVQCEKCTFHLRLQKRIHRQIADFSENAVKSLMFMEKKDFPLQ